MEKRDQIVEQLQKNAENGKISCTAARKMAEELKVSPRDVGAVCDELKIKIFSCELGCF
ncbi:MAG: hypothetical protein ACM3UZ_05120 [Acidobacteriota bacterium]